MGLLTSLGRILLGEPAKPEKAETNVSVDQESVPEKKNNADNAIITRTRIKKASLALLDSLYMADSSVCPEKHLVLWLDTDPTTFNSYSGFEQELQDFWTIERDYTFKKVEVRAGQPDGPAKKLQNLSDLFDVYLQEQTKVSVKTNKLVKKAQISIFGKKGLLLQDKYELSSEELANEHRKYYNIGRGEFPEMNGASYRQNHIVIDDANGLEHNKYVSRAHARIGYSDSLGFYLQVEQGGSRLSGNRTRLFRGEEKIEMENVAVSEPLRDGDLIELGKAVVLVYKEIQ